MRALRYGSLLAVLALASVVGLVPAAGPPAIPKSDTPPPIPKCCDGGVTTSEIALEGETSATYLGEVKIRNVPTGSAVVWDVTPEDAGAKVRVIKAEKAIVFAGPAGTYTVKARVTKGEDVTADLRKVVTLSGGPAPVPVPPTPVPPGPTPTPIPPHPPEPGGQVSTFVVVEDTTKAGPWRGEILASAEVERYYRQLRGSRAGLIHLLVDVNDPQGDEAGRYAKLAAGKQLPYVFLRDAAGKTVKEFPAKISSPLAFLDDFDLHGSEPRALGLIMEAPKLSWTEFGTTPNTPLIPRAQWPKSRRMSAFLPPAYDQDGIGQCASSACAGLTEFAAYMQGVPFPKLSAGDLYSRVNGGRDAGSRLEDNLAEATKNGIAPASMVPYVWDRRRHDTAAVIAERKKYRIAQAYWCPTFDAMVSAILQGYVVGHGLMWFDNFKPDRDGWLPMKGVCYSNRCPGGHALYGYGIETKADGTVGIVTRNSWSGGWGVAGDGIIPEVLFTGQIGGYYAVRVVTSPTAVGKALFNDLRDFALAW